MNTTLLRGRASRARDPVREAVELVNRGRLLEAESLLIELAESAGLLAATRCQLARFALEIGKPHLALGLLQEAIASAPRSPDVRFLAGISARALGHLTEAKDHLLLAQPDSNPDAAYYLSLVQEALGDIKGARNAIQLDLKNHPQDADYLNQAACIASRSGQFDEALDKSEQAHRAEPESAGFAFNHAQNLLLAGRAEEAWPLVEVRLAFTPEHLYPENGATAWQGQSLDGKSILVWHEQGLGDSMSGLAMGAAGGKAARGIPPPVFSARTNPATGQRSFKTFKKKLQIL